MNKRTIGHKKFQMVFSCDIDMIYFFKKDLVIKFIDVENLTYDFLELFLVYIAGATGISLSRFSCRTHPAPCMPGLVFLAGPLKTPIAVFAFDFRS